MTMYSKDDKLVLISQMPENPTLPDKLEFLKKTVKEVIIFFVIIITFLIIVKECL